MIGSSSPLDKSQFLSDEFLDLEAVAQNKKESYANADPFPSIVIDNLFQDSILNAVIDELPDLSKQGSKNVEQFKDAAQKKLASRKGDELQGPNTKLFMAFLNSYTFITFLQKLTGIKETLLPDPYFLGGGLHEIKKGGHLNVHIDFNKHRITKLDRRINILVYLNKDWDESYGGYLELWDQDMKRCGNRILPFFNRTVVFSSTDFSYHGHPDPLDCPEDRSRRSLALYYYSNGRPKSEVSGSDKSTVFRERPGEEFLTFKDTLKNVTLDWTPPIVLRQLRRGWNLDLIRRLRGRDPLD